MKGGGGIVTYRQVAATGERQKTGVRRNTQKPEVSYLITFILSRQLSRKQLLRHAVI